jgi:hypothetical protein
MTRKMQNSHGILETVSPKLDKAGINPAATVTATKQSASYRFSYRRGNKRTSYNQETIDDLEEPVPAEHLQLKVAFSNNSLLLQAEPEEYWEDGEDDSV